MAEEGEEADKEAQAVSARVCRFSGVVGFYNWKLKWHMGHRDRGRPLRESKGTYPTPTVKWLPPPG